MLNTATTNEPAQSQTAASTTTNTCVGQPLKVPSAIWPPSRINNQDALDDMEPFAMPQLPQKFIPYGVAGFYRMPPVLRRGYPITTAALHHLLEGQDFDEIPVPGTTEFSEAIYTAQWVLEGRLQWPINWELVHGIPELCIFETCNNYVMGKAMPAPLEEQLGKEMMAEGPPKWHLDLYKDSWDW